MTSDVKLGYIGLGNQGAPMAKRLLDWPGGLTVFDVREEALAPFVAGGATAAATVAEVADADTLEPLSRLTAGRRAVALLAVRIGPVRLIDNTILMESPAESGPPQGAWEPHP